MIQSEHSFRITESIVMFVVIFTWLTGIVIAKGVWSTIFAITIPPYAWYLLVEKITLGWFS